MKKIILFVIVFALFFVGCGVKKFNSKILQGDWILIEGKKENTPIPLKNLFLNFSIADDTDSASEFIVNGFSGVNTFFGPLSFDGNKIIHSGQLGSTRMMGLPKLAEAESLFMDAFLATETITAVNSDEIVLSGSNETELKYERFRLSRLRFNLKKCFSEEFENLDDVSGDVPHLFFDKNGGVSGNTGINSLNLGYKSDATETPFMYNLSFSEGAMTLAASGDDMSSRLEGIFLSYLMQTSFVKLENNGNVTFLNGENSPLLMFETVYEK